MPTTRHDRSRSKLTRGGRPAGSTDAAAASTPVAPAAAASAVVWAPPATAVARESAVRSRNVSATGITPSRTTAPDHARIAPGAAIAIARPEASGPSETPASSAAPRRPSDSPARAGSARTSRALAAAMNTPNPNPPSARPATRCQVSVASADAPSAATMSSTPMTPMVRARPRSAKGATMSSAASDAAKPAAATNPMSAVEMPSCDWSVGSSGKMTMAPEDMSTVAVTTPAVSRRRCWSTAVRSTSLLVHMDSTVPPVVRMDKSATMEAW